MLRRQRKVPQPDAGPASRPVEDELIWEAQMQQGVCFRWVLLTIFALTMLLLLWLKWDRENLVPLSELKQQAQTSKQGDGKPAPGTEPDEVFDKYYSMLNVQKDDAHRALRVEEQYKKLSEELDPTKNPECGEDCSSKLVQLRDAYNALSSYVPHPYHQVLNVPRNAGTRELRKAFEVAKAKAERGESTYELPEIKEAYDIMSHPAARDYYNLYETKPPAMIKHQQKTTHPGWGVEMGMGTYKYAVLHAWLDYFNNGWIDLAFFAVVILVVVAKLWSNKNELMAKIEQIEAMERLLDEE